MRVIQRFPAALVQNFLNGVKGNNLRASREAWFAAGPVGSQRSPRNGRLATERVVTTVVADVVRI